MTCRGGSGGFGFVPTTRLGPEGCEPSAMDLMAAACSAQRERRGTRVRQRGCPPPATEATTGLLGVRLVVIVGHRPNGDPGLLTRRTATPTHLFDHPAAGVAEEADELALVGRDDTGREFWRHPV
jgi:hypothetical protein